MLNLMATKVGITEVHQHLGPRKVNYLGGRRDTRIQHHTHLGQLAAPGRGHGVKKKVGWMANRRMAPRKWGLLHTQGLSSLRAWAGPSVWPTSERLSPATTSTRSTYLRSWRNKVRLVVGA